MWNKKKNTQDKPQQTRQKPAFLEILECRQLLSATHIAHPDLTISPLVSSSVLQGYTAAQIRHAYGFDKLTNNGAGQTIAIVDAYNDPNIINDLHVFDLKMGIADPPSFKVVSQTGGSVAGLKTDAGWATEMALDVEWAHAIAPGAKILLVEANNDSISSLMAAVNTARNAAGVSVVSLSWGGSEFWGQQSYDSILTTPAGHQGVTFVASSGDDGSWYGLSWPSTSPNVLSVGGTSLYTTGGNGTYSSETGWSDSGGGVSEIYSEPSYQSAAQTTGGRTNPDVSYNANPSTGFAVYDSLSYEGYSGWQVYGGTSAGAPQWASLIAIANQTRVQAGKTTLDGVSGTIPALYKLYATPNSASYATYTSTLNDITSGRTSYFLAAHTGYDGVTGLGSPKAPQVVAALNGVASTAIKAATAKAKITALKTVRRAIASIEESVATLTPPAPLVLQTAAAAIETQTTPPLPDAITTTDRAARMLDNWISVASQSLTSATTLTANPMPEATSSRDLPLSLNTMALEPQSDLLPDFSGLPAATLSDTQLEITAFTDPISVLDDAATPIAQFAAPESSNVQDWAAPVTAAAIDALLIATWIGSRQHQSRKTKPVSANPLFSMQPIVA